MQQAMDARMTPWVFRLLLANAIVLLLMQTVVTSPAFADLVAFDPALALQRPWTFVSYIFVHGGLFHLLGNSLALFVFGPVVERRLGPVLFPLYYLFCGIGAALVSLALWFLAPAMIAPFVGASGAVLGVAFAFAKFLPDAELIIFPWPRPIKARHLVMVFAAFDVFGAWLGADNIAHVAHLGGMAFGWLFFRARGAGREPELPRMTAVRSRPPVPVRNGPAPRQPMVSARAEAAGAPVPAPLDPAIVEKAEIDRVLDKILASGIDSLTPDERRFLEAQRRRGETH